MPQVEMEKVEPLLEQFEDHRSNLIPILQDVQETYRYLPQDVLRKIAQKLRVPLDRRLPGRNFLPLLQPGAAG